MADPYVSFHVQWPEDDKGRIKAVGKGRPRFSTIGGFARAYTPAATRKFENRIKEAGIFAMARNHLEVLDEAVSVDVRALVPVPESWSNKKRQAALAGDIMPTGKPDFDNIQKLLDGLNHFPKRDKHDRERRPIIWRDDSQIVVSQFMKIYSAQPCLQISVFKWF